jgi:translocation and assembly module TamA
MHPGRTALGGCLLLVWGCGADGRPWVRNVTFVGATAVQTRALKRKLAVESTSWIGFPKRHLDAAAVEKDRQRIEAYYRAHGFFDARVTAAEVVPRGGSSVDVRFLVEEGEPTRIEGVEVHGLETVPERERLVKRVHHLLATGSVLEHARYLDARNGLADGLRRLGHAWAEVVGRVEVDPAAHAAHVTIATEPGPVVHFGQVRVDGTRRVPARRVARHVGIRDGARFDPARIDEAQGRVYALGLFSSVRVEAVPSSSDPAVADVLVHVRESSPGELRLGGGIGIDSYRTDLHAEARLLRHHWLGGLRTLELRFEPGFAAVPALWDPDRSGPSLLAEATLIQHGWPGRARLAFTLGYDVGVEYAYQYQGPRMRLGLQRGFWRDHLLVAAAYEFELLQFFNVDPVIVDEPTLQGRFFGFTNPYRVGWFQEEVALDLRDFPPAARRGVYAGLTFEQGGPYAGGAFRYQKVVPDLRFYAPLGRRVTFATRFLFGQLFTQGDLGSPITRRFYLGGASSHRGFAYDRLSPQVPSGNPSMPAIPVGGDQMVLVSAELRVDVLRLSGNWVALATFVDGGDVGTPSCGGVPACSRVPSTSGVDWGDLNWAVGGGLRYRTPLGVVRVDVGVRLNRLSPFEPNGTPNPDPGQRVAFHLSLGEAF